MTELKRLFLEEKHKEQHAKFAAFAGWNMPVQYQGVISEHHSVREQCGLFDVSHMGEILIEGENAEIFLQYVTCNDVSKLVIGRAQYSALLNEKAGVIDDIIIYKLENQKFLLCVNASNSKEDELWLRKQSKDFGITIDNQSDNYCLLAIQGKSALALVEKLFGKIPVKRFSFFVDENIIVARTGYTGEDGVEIFIKNEVAKEWFDKITTEGRSFGLALCGLGARDSLRLEAAYPLHGHELLADVRADESGLSWIIKLQKANFIGKETLLETPPKYELIGLEILEPGIARQGAVVYGRDAEIVGVITSGTKTPCLDKPIAIARVIKSETDSFLVGVRDKKLLCVKRSMPFI